MEQAELEAMTAEKVVDARGTACPGPLLEAKKAMGTVRVGQVVEVRSNDEGSRKDIPMWATKVGHEYLGQLGADGFDRHLIRRNK